jgi:hypothetical protein
VHVRSGETVFFLDVEFDELASDLFLKLGLGFANVVAEVVKID